MFSGSPNGLTCRRRRERSERRRNNGGFYQSCASRTKSEGDRAATLRQIRVGMLVPVRRNGPADLNRDPSAHTRNFGRSFHRHPNRLSTSSRGSAHFRHTSLSTGFILPQFQHGHGSTTFVPVELLDFLLSRFSRRVLDESPPQLLLQMPSRLRTLFFLRIHVRPGIW